MLFRIKGPPYKSICLTDIYSKQGNRADLCAAGLLKRNEYNICSKITDFAMLASVFY